MRVWVMDPRAPDASVVAEAGAIVKAGGLVAFPTETVYGLAADATNPLAIERLNRVKGRPPEKPYSYHVHDRAQVAAYVDAVPAAAQRLMDRFWPGPLTIVMPAKRGGTIGFRLPEGRVAIEFLRQCGCAVVAPSANRSGALPPTTAKQIVDELGTDIDGVLDAGPTSVGRESTVVQVIGNDVRLLREGAVPMAEIVRTVGSVVRGS